MKFLHLAYKHIVKPIGAIFHVFEVILAMLSQYAMHSAPIMAMPCVVPVRAGYPCGLHSATGCSVLHSCSISHPYTSARYFVSF